MEFGFGFWRQLGLRQTLALFKSEKNKNEMKNTCGTNEQQ